MQETKMDGLRQYKLCNAVYVIYAGYKVLMQDNVS